MNTEVKKKARWHSMIKVLTVTQASKTWTWNKCQRSRIQAVAMSYLRGGCGVSRKWMVRVLKGNELWNCGGGESRDFFTTPQNAD